MLIQQLIPTLACLPLGYLAFLLLAALLLAWFAGQTLVMGLAGAVIGSGLAGTRLRRLFGLVMLLFLLCVITTIIWQSFGVVPTSRLS